MGKPKGFFQNGKWYCGAYVLILSRIKGEDYVVLGDSINTYDFFGGRSDVNHNQDLHETASAELMEETSGLIRVSPDWFDDSLAIDFEMYHYRPHNVPRDQQMFGRCYCMHLANLNQKDFDHNYRLLKSKSSTPNHFVEMKRVAHFKMKDLIDALAEQMEKEGQIIHGIRVRPYDLEKGEYRKIDVINRRTTKLIAAHLDLGTVDALLSKEAIDVEAERKTDQSQGFLKGTYYYRVR